MSSPYDEYDSKPRRDDNDDSEYVDAEPIEEAEYDDEVHHGIDAEEGEYHWWDNYDPDTVMGKMARFIGKEETAPHAHLAILLFVVVMVAIVVAIIG